MSEMVERVARAIDPAAWRGGILDAVLRRRSLEKARDAIEAMREPTEEMIAGAHRAWDRTHHGPGPFTIERMWRAGIDAALVSGERGRGMSEWQPIETAPKDGTRILGYFPSRGWARERIAETKWLRGWFGGWTRHGEGPTATYWMPLPTTPTEPKGQ